jgi:hypothetical protein
LRIFDYPFGFLESGGKGRRRSIHGGGSRGFHITHFMVKVLVAMVLVMRSIRISQKRTEESEQ